MPKAPKPSKISKAGPASAAAGPSKKAKSAQTPSTYSSFIPIPLSIPSPTPIPSSSSSKSLNSTTHYLYARANERGDSSTSSGTGLGGPSGTKEALPADRTVFVANIPVDMGEHTLRGVFTRWGVVESVSFTGGRGADGLEMAVLGIEPDSDDEEDDDGEEHDEQGETVEEPGDGEAPSGPKFIGDTSLPRRQRKRLNKLPSSVPTVTPLPPLDPRTANHGEGNSYHPSGLRCAHIIYLDSSPLTSLLSPASAHSIIPITPDPTLPVGLPYYLALHSSLRPSLPSIRAFADTSMARFDHLSSLLLSARAKVQGAGALVDEDGFTVVVRSGKRGRTGGFGDGTTKGTTSIGVASRGFSKKVKNGDAAGKKGKGKGAGELVDFYKFQKMERKSKELAELRSQFKKDTEKVAAMRQAKRFKPY